MQIEQQMAFHVWSDEYVGVLLVCYFFCATDISHKIITRTSKQSLCNIASNHIVLVQSWHIIVTRHSLMVVWTDINIVFTGSWQDLHWPDCTLFQLMIMSHNVPLFVVLHYDSVFRGVPCMSNMNLLQVILIHVTVTVKLHFSNFCIDLLIWLSA